MRAEHHANRREEQEEQEEQWRNAKKIRPPINHLITPTYVEYKRAFEEACKIFLSLRNEQVEADTFKPDTFIEEVWKERPEYLRAESLYAQYSEEAKEIYRQSRETIGKATREQVIWTLAPA